MSNRRSEDGSPAPHDQGSALFSQRSLRQFAIYAVGASCVLLSATLTRRAVVRRQVRQVPRLFTPNTTPHEHFSPFMDAVHALGFATMNVASVSIMLGGGVLWAADISGLDEMRATLRRRLGYPLFESAEPESPGADSAESLADAVARKRRQAAADPKDPKDPKPKTP